MIVELKPLRKRRQADNNCKRVRHNAAIEPNSSGKRARKGDKALVKKVDRMPIKEAIDAILAHARRTGPWRMTPAEQLEEGGISSKHPNLR